MWKEPQRQHRGAHAHSHRWGNWGFEKLRHLPKVTSKGKSQDLNPGLSDSRVRFLNHSAPHPALGSPSHSRTPPRGPSLQAAGPGSLCELTGSSRLCAGRLSCPSHSPAGWGQWWGRSARPPHTPRSSFFLLCPQHLLQPTSQRLHRGWRQCQGEDTKRDFLNGKGVRKHPWAGREDVRSGLYAEAVAILGNDASLKTQPTGVLGPASPWGGVFGCDPATQQLDLWSLEHGLRAKFPSTHTHLSLNPGPCLGRQRLQMWASKKTAS